MGMMEGDERVSTADADDAMLAEEGLLSIFGLGDDVRKGKNWEAKQLGCNLGLNEGGLLRRLYAWRALLLLFFKWHC